MKHFFRLCQIASILLVFGCIPSVNPIYTDDDIVFDEDLVGVWEAVEEYDEYDWITLDFDEFSKTSYELGTTGDEGTGGVYSVHLVRIGGSMFLDLFPDELDVTEEQEEVLESIAEAYYLFHFRPLHTFLKLEKSGDSLVVSMIDPDWLEKYIEENPEEVRHGFIDGNNSIGSFIFTDTTENMQKFLNKHINTVGAFSGRATFRRKSRISRAWIIDSRNIKTVAEAATILEEYPDEIEIYRIRAKLFLKEGHLDEALTDYAKAIELEPTYIYNYYLRAKAYMANDKYDLAMADIARAIQLDPANSIFYEWRAKAKISKGKFGQAIPDFSKLIKLNPSIYYYYRRAELYTKTGEYDKAIADHSKNIEMEPSNKVHYSRRAEVYVTKGDYDLAIADYSKAIELRPKRREYYSKRANVYLKKGDYDLAIADYNKLIELNPKQSSYYNRQKKAIYHQKVSEHLKSASEYLRKDKYDSAIKHLDQAIKLAKRDARAFELKAWILATCQDARYRDGAVAVELAGWAVMLDSKPVYLDTLAAAYAEAGRLEDAVRTQKRAISLLIKEQNGSVEIAKRSVGVKKFEERLMVYETGKPWREWGRDNVWGY
jgi:tetratricopeptide (TPR) repeat protein